MPKDVIIACDFSSRQTTLKFLKQFKEEKPYVKIGMELFYAEGPDIVREIKSLGHQIFLDLKLHDIPNTVKKAFKILADLQVDMLNLHAAGGSQMMRFALAGLEEAKGLKPLLIAVTQLTSVDEKMLKEELFISQSMPDTVMHYAENAADSGLDGVVCSPLEAAKIKAACGEQFLTITPGIRFADELGKDDQKRVMTPRKAKEAGSDYIVVGRPITQAKNPLEQYRRCVRDFLE